MPATEQVTTLHRVTSGRSDFPPARQAHLDLLEAVSLLTAMRMVAGLVVTDDDDQQHVIKLADLALKKVTSAQQHLDESLVSSRL